MQRTERKFRFRIFLFLLVPVVCSLFLTYLSITPPVIPTDWARLDALGMYVPVRLDYAWPSYAAQVGLWLVMVGAIGLSAVSSQRSAKEEKRNAEIQRNRVAEGYEKKSYGVIWILAVITLLGFGLRLHTLDALPLLIDEIGFAAHASDILHGQHVPIFAPGHNANPSVYSWLVAGAMALFGQNTFAIRLLPLVFGTLSIPAIYALGRAWWSRRVGLLAAAFLATYPAHIFFSRLSLYNLVDPFFAMLALAFLPHPLTPSPLRREGEQQRRWIMAGLLAGIAQYFYHGSRLLLVLLAVYGVLSAIKQREKRIPEEQRYREAEENYQILCFSVPLNLCVTLLWFCLSFAVVALPRFAPVLVNRLPVTGNEAALRLPADLGANSLRALLAWVGQPDVSPFWLSGAPLLEWPALLAVAVGLVVSLRRWRDPRYAALIASVALVTVVGGAIWAAAPLYVRYMTAVPAIGLLLAVGIEKIKSVSQRYKGTEAQRRDVGTRYIVAAQLIAITVIAVQGIYAAARQPAAFARVTASQWIEQDLAQKAAALPLETGAVLIVPADFNEVQQITIAHYVAALGQRRVVALAANSDVGVSLAAQLGRLQGHRYTVLRPR